MVCIVITISIKNAVNSSRKVLKQWFCKFVRENLSSTPCLTLSHIKKLSSKQEAFSDTKAAENVILCVKYSILFQMVHLLTKEYLGVNMVFYFCNYQ